MSNDNKQTQANQRRAFSPEQKIKILREHLLDKTPISAVCEQHQMSAAE